MELKRTKKEKLRWSVKGHEIALSTLGNEMRITGRGTFAEKRPDYADGFTELQEKSR